MNVVIYTTESCSYCLKAKELLNSKGISYNERKNGVDFSRDFLTENYPSAKTYPVVIIDGFHIGGYNELKKLIEENSKDTKILLNEGE